MKTGTKTHSPDTTVPFIRYLSVFKVTIDEQLPTLGICMNYSFDFKAMQGHAG